MNKLYTIKDNELKQLKREIETYEVYIEIYATMLIASVFMFIQLLLNNNWQLSLIFVASMLTCLFVIITNTCSMIRKVKELKQKIASSSDDCCLKGEKQ